MIELLKVLQVHGVRIGLKINVKKIESSRLGISAGKVVKLDLVCTLF